MDSMKLKLLTKGDTAQIVGVVNAETGESLEGVKSIDLDVSDQEVTITLDFSQVKLGIKEVIPAK